MTPFQWITLAAIALVLVRQVAALRRSRAGRRMRLLGIAVALAAGAAIAEPDLVTAVARAIGIGRGADVVLYVSVLAFTLVAFFLYARLVALRRDLTEITRRMAIEGARRGSAAGRGADGAEQAGGAGGEDPVER